MGFVIKCFLIVLVVLVAGAIAAGRLGWLRGSPPLDLGVRDGRLKAPSNKPNSISSQAGLHLDHPRRSDAQVEPLRYQGDGAAALARLKALVEATEGAQIVRSEPAYLYATYSSRLMRYVDDVEFHLDPAAGVIHVRSASRIGYSDRGANRARIEALRARFAAG